MSRSVLAALAGMLIVVPVLVISSHAHAQMDIIEGLEVRVIAEVPSDVPGMEKVRILRVIMQPGSGWTEITQLVE